MLKLGELQCTQLLIFLVRPHSCRVLLSDETRLRHVVALATEISDLWLRFTCILLLLLIRLLHSICFLLRCSTIMLSAAVDLGGKCSGRLNLSILIVLALLLTKGQH